MAEPNELEAIFAEPTAPTQEPAAPSPAPEAPKVDATPPAPQTPAAEQPKAPEGYIPIAAMLDEREKRQKFEKELADLRAQQQPQQQPPLQTPEEIAAYVQERTARAEWNAKASTSEIYAREKHGDETVNSAVDWAIQRCEKEIALLGYSPFRDEQIRHQNPVDWIVRQHKKDKAFSEFGDDEAAQKLFVERKAREWGLIPASPSASAPAPAAPQPTPPITPPAPSPRRSQASDTSAGGPQTPVLKTEQDVFKEAFS